MSLGLPASGFIEVGQLTWYLMSIFSINRLKSTCVVAYQSYYQRKMGWQVQVVDGGLSDMYNTSHLLADNEVSIKNFH